MAVYFEAMMSFWCGICRCRYKVLVSDVLLSVKKTEDSMQRLKKARRSLANQTTAGDGNPSVELSDEDKIRLQLFLDVESFGTKVCY